MSVWQTVLYLFAILLLVVAAFGPPVRVSFALLGAACALLAYALPTIAAHTG
jgi:hypothetical protein